MHKHTCTVTQTHTHTHTHAHTFSAYHNGIVTSVRSEQVSGLPDEIFIKSDQIKLGKIIGEGKTTSVVAAQNRSLIEYFLMIIIVYNYLTQCLLTLF